MDKIKDEETKRKELSGRFNVTLNEITTLMQSNTEQNTKLREENKELVDKFKIICEQYELRESVRMIEIGAELWFKRSYLSSKSTS